MRYKAYVNFESQIWFICFLYDLWLILITIFQSVNQNQGYDYQNYDYQQHYQPPIEHQNGHVQQPDLVAAAPPDTNPEAEQVTSPAEQALADPNTASANQNFRENVDQRSEASPSRSIEPGHSFGTGPDIIAASNHDEETIEQASEMIEQAYPGVPGNDLWPFLGPMQMWLLIINVKF